MNVKHYIKGKILLFEITEDLDHHQTEKIRNRADYEIQRFMPERVIIDFKSVNFMDSAGIGLIIGRYKQVSAMGGKLELIFDMAGILKIIPIVSI